MITWRELRQGSLFTDLEAQKIIDKSIGLVQDSLSSENISLVVLSQDCDIVNDIDKEPYIEFIVSKKCSKIDGNLKDGKNPRNLNIQESDSVYFFCIHDKFRVKKQELKELNLEERPLILCNDNLAILKKWIAKRYIRAAFPDNFNSRLGNSNQYKRIADKNISKNVKEVFIDVTDEELSEGSIYEPKILVVVPDSLNEDLRDEIDEAYNDAFTTTDVNPDIYVVTEDEVTLNDLRQYKRWDKDYYSLNGEQKPFDEIDII